MNKNTNRVKRNKKNSKSKVVKKNNRRNVIKKKNNRVYIILSIVITLAVISIVLNCLGIEGIAFLFEKSEPAFQVLDKTAKLYGLYKMINELKGDKKNK